MMRSKQVAKVQTSQGKKGSSAAAALQRAEEEARGRLRQVTALLVAANALVPQRPFAESARVIFDACRTLVGATGGYVALLSEDGLENEVVFLESGGLPCSVDPTLPMPIRGLRAEAYRTGEVVYDNQFARSAWAGLVPSGHVELRNVLFAPLVLDGRTVGLLGLANKPGDFTEEDARIAAGFGELAAVGLRSFKAANSLESSQAQFRSVVATASDAIICTDGQGNIVLWNEGAHLLFGYEAQEVLGRPVARLVPERFRESHLAGFSRALEGLSPRRVRRSVEVMGLTKDGDEVPLELSLATWTSGEGLFFTGIGRDITERKQAEREAEHQQQIIQEMSTPVLPLCGGLLIVPLIGTVHAPRARQLTTQVLRSIRNHRARVVVMDITGVPVMDTSVAATLLQIAEAARLLGAEVILTGISREIAQTLVTLGVEMGRIRTSGDLQSGVEEAQRLLRCELLPTGPSKLVL